MRSSTKFGLSANENAPIIKATIILTDDVRDEIAKKFIEGFGYESNLAYVQFKPMEIISGQTDIEIFPIKLRAGSSRIKELPTEQARLIIEVLKHELERRETTAPTGEEDIFLIDNQ